VETDDATEEEDDDAPVDEGSDEDDKPE